MNPPPRLVIFGCGYTGLATARLARERGWSVLTNVRSSAHAAALRADGFPVLESTAVDALAQASLDVHSHILVALPPSAPDDDQVFTDRLHALGTRNRSGAAFASLVYISSTGIYGAHRGRVDEDTPIAASDPRAARLKIAEDAYRAIGGTIFRSSAIYGPDRGLHRRVVGGEHRIPGDGTSFTSRIHVDDLAALILAASTADSAVRALTRGHTFVIGDREPARQIEVVRWICQTYKVPFPPFVPSDAVHETLRADRQVDATRVWTTLGLAPRYPTYREGFATLTAPA